MTIKIAIVGGGYSGLLTAVHLMTLANETKISVTLFDPAMKPGRGLAYGTSDDNLLLNVPAGNMSAFGSDVGHFVRYCQTIDPAFHDGTFVSRRIYGDYLQSLLLSVKNSEHAHLKTVGQRVIAIELANQGTFLVKLEDESTEQFDKVVLALGHFGSLPPLSGLAPELSAAFIAPTNTKALANINSDAPVLVIGTGLTAADTIFKLSSMDLGLKFIAMSRRGLVSRVHRMHPKAPRLRPAEYVNQLPPTVRAYLRRIREEIERCTSEGGDWRDVINQLRPMTPAIWQKFALSERRRFLRHLVPFWDVHRHRLAPMAYQRLQNLVTAGQLEFRAARLQSIKAMGKAWEVQFLDRLDKRVYAINVSAIINCTGPNGDITKNTDTLIQQLLSAGLISADDLRLGLRTSDTYEVLGRTGRATQNLLYVGPMLKATFWEAIAVPELRHHTENVARRLLGLS